MIIYSKARRWSALRSADPQTPMYDIYFEYMSGGRVLVGKFVGNLVRILDPDFLFSEGSLEDLLTLYTALYERYKKENSLPG